MAAIMKHRAWFYRYSGWNGATYYWPCNWYGALLMLAAIALAIGLSGTIASEAQTLGHPMLGWLSFIAVIVIYGGFDRIAARHARD